MNEYETDKVMSIVTWTLGAVGLVLIVVICIGKWLYGQG